MAQERFPRSAAWTLGLAVAVAAAVGCDSQGTIPGGGSATGSSRDELRTGALTPEPSQYLENEVLGFRVDRLGGIAGTAWNLDPGDPTLRSWLLSMAGLWLAAERDGIRSNTVGTRGNGFEFDSTGYGPVGVFKVDRESDRRQIVNWPSRLGAPADPDGSPRLYGDRMAWAAYVPSARFDPDRALSDLGIALSAWMWDRQDLSESFFLRYDVTNRGTEAYRDLHVGFGADPDLFRNRTGVAVCPGLTYWHNQVGYDPERRLTFVYTARHAEDGEQADACYGLVEGFAILDTSAPEGLGPEMLAHRIWTRQEFNTPYPNFSGERLEAGQVALWALQGLSATGEPMIDPTTGQATRFAFTGDPVAGTGWISERTDWRSLLSLRPIELAPGETRSMTVVWIVAQGVDLEDGLNRFRSRFDAIAAERGLWDY